MMRFKTKIAVLAMSLFNLMTICQGQEVLNNYVDQFKPKTAFNAIGYKKDDDDVELGTGTLVQTINLFNLEERTISVPVRLSYAGSGIKVKDVSGPVGLGWQLQAGGQIRRQVVGVEDERLLSDPVLNWQKHDMGWLDTAERDWAIYNGPFPFGVPGQPIGTELCAGAIDRFIANVKASASTGIPPSTQPTWSGWMQSITVNMALVAGQTFYGQFDGQADIFTFNLCGRSGKFVFDKTGEPIPIPYQDIKIIPPFGPKSIGDNRWTFIFNDGMRFYLSNAESNRETTTSIINNDPYLDVPGGNSNEGQTHTAITSAWMLSSIEDASGRERVNFSYTDGDPITYSNKSTFAITWMATFSGDWNIYNGPMGGDEEIIQKVTQITISPKTLVTIDLVNSGASLKFFMGNTNRLDLPGTKYLEEIYLVNCKGETVKKFKFNYDYFVSPNAGTLTSDHYRLKLLSIKEDNLSALTTFDYNSTPLPERNSPAHDHWGYYNLNTASNALPPLYYNESGIVTSSPGATTNAPNLLRTQACALTSITWPTGGKKEFYYQLHSHVNGSSNEDVGGLRIWKINNYTGPVNQITEYLYQDLNNTSLSSGIASPLGELWEKREVTWWDNDLNIIRTYRVGLRYSDPKFLDQEHPIHYSAVTKVNPDQSKTVYSLSTQNDFADFEHQRMYCDITKASDNFAGFPQINQNVRPSLPSFAKTYLHGLIKKQTDYNNSGQIVKSIENTYEVNPSGYTPKSVNCIAIETITSVPVPEVDATFSSFNFEPYTYTSDWFYLKTQEIKEYNSNSTIDMVKTVHQYTYDPNTKLLVSDGYNASDAYMLTSFAYPSDMVALGNDPTGTYQGMVNQYMKSIPIQTVLFQDGTIAKVTRTNYSIQPALPQFTRNLYLPSSVEIKEGNFPSEVRLLFNKYDELGNTLEQQKKDGIKEVFLWGYRNTYPIARILGVDYATASQYFNQSLANNVQTTEGQMRSMLQNLRTNLSSALVYTYTYSPLVGLISETDPMGQALFYEYDDMGRLVIVRNNDGHILKKNSYQINGPQ